jgi:hypothetical protein
MPIARGLLIRFQRGLFDHALARDHEHHLFFVFEVAHGQTRGHALVAR